MEKPKAIDEAAKSIMAVVVALVIVVVWFGVFGRGVSLVGVGQAAGFAVALICVRYGLMQKKRWARDLFAAMVVVVVASALYRHEWVRIIAVAWLVPDVWRLYTLPDCAEWFQRAKA